MQGQVDKMLQLEVQRHLRLAMQLCNMLAMLVPQSAAMKAAALAAAVTMAAVTMTMIDL